MAAIAFICEPWRLIFLGVRRLDERLPLLFNIRSFYRMKLRFHRWVLYITASKERSEWFKDREREMEYFLS